MQVTFGDFFFFYFSIFLFFVSVLYCNGAVVVLSYLIINIAINNVGGNPRR